MGKNTLKRKDFFKTFLAPKAVASIASESGDPTDPLFEKYARKSLGQRVYASQASAPGTPNTEAARVGNITSGIAPYTGTFTQWEAAHLLRRMGYGLKKTDLENTVAAGMQAAVDALLITPAVAQPSPTALNHYQLTLADSGGILLGESWTQNNLSYVNPDDGTNNSLRQQSLTAWTWGVTINEGTSIREKMMQCWYHFIPINFDDVRSQRNNSATICNDYMRLLRNNCLGNFKTLIKAIALEPAMLVYLGNQFSTATVPNENFARELMELFMLGKVPTQNYAEMDVQAAAKVLSGWRVANYNAAYPLVAAFNSSYHNQSNKTFSSFFDGATINNQTGVNGANEFNIFFDLLFTKQQDTIAKYVCRRLYRFFVYYDIDTNIEANVIVPLATLFKNSNWEIAPVIKALFKSEHFYDMANRGVMIKSPVDFIAGTLRTLNINTTPVVGATQIQNQYSIWNYFQNYANSNLEQAMGLVPNVSGWKAYYQDPTYYQNWINSNSIQRRASLLTAFVNGYGSGGTSIKIDPIAWVQQFPTATIQDPDLLMDAVLPYLLSLDLPAAYKQETKVQTLLAGQVTNNYWTTAWNNYVANPTTSNTNLVRSRLNSMLTTFLQLAEYQLM